VANQITPGDCVGLACMVRAAMVQLTYPWHPDEGAEAAGVAALVAALAALVAGLVAGRGRGGAIIGSPFQTKNFRRHGEQPRD